MIVHLDTARTWRGGQQQVWLLQRELQRLGLDSAIAAPRDSVLLERCRRTGLRAFQLTRPALFDRRLLGARILHAHDSHAATIAACATRLAPLQDTVCHRRLSYPLAAGHARRWKYRRVARWIAVSAQIRAQLQAAGIDRQRIATIPSTIDGTATRELAADADIDALRREFGVSHATQVLLSVGSLVEQKAHRTVLEATAELLARRAGVVLLVAGDGPGRSALEDHSAKLGLSHEVIFAGFRTDIPALLRLADVCVAASCEGEGSPASIKEAVLAGTSLVATDTPAHREILGETMRLVPPGDAHALADHVTRVLASPKTETETTLAPRFRDPTVMAERTLAVYRSLLGGEALT